MPLRDKLQKSRGRGFVIVIVLFVILQIEGCYYMQAVRGQLQVMNRRQPIPEVLADAASPAELKRRLTIVQEARNFAVDSLLLPDNESYRSYADLGRDYVVWNVFAAPEFSLEPKTWCFPVAGCVAYRGYFAEEAARKKAKSLSDNGFDVVVGGVSAYSTLGKFSDPVLNTMMRWTDVRLVSTIFHELAHQKLYIKGDTAFNESFATAVADIGIKRWLNEHSALSGAEGMADDRELRQAMMVLIEAGKAELTELYASEIQHDLKRRRKQEILADLSASVARLIEERGADPGNWLSVPLNNARLASIGLYEGRQGAFQAILRNCNEDLACFYDETEELAKLDPDVRNVRMDQMAD